MVWDGLGCSQVTRKSCKGLRRLWQTNIAIEKGPGMKMYVLLKMVIFHCHVSLPEGI